MKYLSLFFVCSTILFTSCKSPTEVDAYRDRQVSQPTDLFGLDIGENIIDFRTVRVAGSKSTQVALFNTSRTNPVEIRTLRFKNNSIHFTTRPVAGNLPIVLDAQERAADNKQIYIEFWPKEVGTFIDTLVLNDSKDKFIVVKGKATDGALPPEIVIAAKTPVELLNFDSCTTDWTKDQHITIENRSEYPVTIIGCSLDESGSGFRTNLAYPITLESVLDDPQAARTSFVLTFRPKEAKDYSRKLKFIVQGEPDPVEVCDIRAIGVKP